MTSDGDVFLQERRRARSLPAYPEQAALFERISRKRVQFADALGLSLASVKHFSIGEEPRVPAAASTPRQGLRSERLAPAFSAPAAPGDVEPRLQRLRVALEKIAVTRLDVRGVIRALTTGCRGTDVGVRYTFDDWLSFVDAQAVPVESEGAAGERFAFVVYTPPFLEPGASAHFAVYSRTEHGDFWDNNDGRNYTLTPRCPESS
ncbi:protein phosphatase 1 regulatory subunit 3G [Denticeps clupeoides]|nr:protein phosphatase 1 regulatory subunit 3G-like [Denticeps clupeoides]